ncbi:hypothetical protein CK203_100598 [Vitis vinifera]|uniref:Uncharacterized protein n=1 Tax=Vitis vinifera TaxID=29760 RepID=A0A438FIJ7_VITVI|nr:hypothetical protein CK203_100598 [Vitis vinifera]
MEHLLAPRDFFYPRVVTDFYQTIDNQRTWAASASSKEEDFPKTSTLKVLPPAPSQPSTSAEPRMAIPYIRISRAVPSIGDSYSFPEQSCSGIGSHQSSQEQMLASQAQQAAILRQLQVHFDLPQAVEPSIPTTPEPHSQPSESQAPEPEASADPATEEADPSALALSTPFIRHYIYLLFMFLCMFVLF